MLFGIDLSPVVMILSLLSVGLMSDQQAGVYEGERMAMEMLSIGQETLESIEVMAALGSMATMSLLLVRRGVSLPQVIPSTNELQVWSKCRSEVHVLEHVFDCPVMFMHTARYLQWRSTWTSRSHCWLSCFLVQGRGERGWLWQEDEVDCAVWYWPQFGGVGGWCGPVGGGYLC